MIFFQCLRSSVALNTSTNDSPDHILMLFVAFLMLFSCSWCDTFDNLFFQQSVGFLIIWPKKLSFLDIMDSIRFLSDSAFSIHYPFICPRHSKSETLHFKSSDMDLAVWLSGNALVSINLVAMMLDPVSTEIGLINHPPRSTQPGHPSVGRHNEYQQKLGSNRAHHVIH